MLARSVLHYLQVMTYWGQCGWTENDWEGGDRQHFRFSDSGPRYIQYMPVDSVGWPDELQVGG